MTAPYEPSQNGTAERTVGLLKDVAQTCLLGSTLPQKFWGEAMATAVYQLNRRSTSTNANGKTPFELWTGKKPDVTGMKVFGCDAFVHVPKEKRKAWSAKTTKMKFVGYQEGTRNYRFVNKHGEITRSPNAIFIENGKTKKIQDKPKRNEELEKRNNEAESEFNYVDSESDDDLEDAIEEQKDQPETRLVRRSERLRRKKESEASAAQSMMESAFVAGTMTVPNSVQEALESETWKQAMDQEFNSLMDRDTWVIVDRPKDRTVVSSRWVFDLKTNELGQVVRAKARFVARGFSQVPGVDFTESYAPVCDPAVLRLCMAYAAEKGKSMKMIDFNCAFLNGTLQEEIYMEQPQGYAAGDARKKVLLLKKAIYRLVQAALEWRRVLLEQLREMGFVPMITDPATYIHKSDGTILNTHVDDVNAIGDEKVLNELIENLEKKFELKRLGETSFIVGVRVEREDRKVFLSQTAYIEKMLERFGLDGINPESTPTIEGVKLVKSEDEDGTVVFKQSYQSKVGSLQYLVKMTRPDIAYATKEVSKHCHNPGPRHMKAVNRIFAYLKKTKDFRLKLEVGRDKLQIQDYADADFAGEKSTGRSTTGFVVRLGEAPVAWRSVDQRCVTLSTLEAECHSLSTSITEAMWLRDVLKEIDNDAEDVIHCFEDNAACVVLANCESLGRAKHIATRFHFVKERVRCGEVKVYGTSSEEMIADGLTKCVPKRLIGRVQEQLKIMPKQEECQNLKAASTGTGVVNQAHPGDADCGSDQLMSTP